MASITIRNLDETVKRKLRLRAAQRNRSMEDEAREILPTGNSRRSYSSARRTAQGH
jgi:plasmid stability protein